LQWWGLLMAVAFSIILTLPIGIIQAISNNQIGLNVVTELVFGYVYPGHPVANAGFKTYGYVTMSQCLMLVSDMKLGHYMKIPPKKLFIVQLYGTLIGALANYGVMKFIFDHRIDELRGLKPASTGQEDPRSSKVFYSASIIWGAFGSDRIFGSQSIYYPLYLFFLLGILLPIPFYLLHKRYPDGKWHLVNIPIMMVGAVTVPTSPANFIVTTFLVSFIFQFYLYRYQHSWWRKYNYVLSAALDSGTQVCGMLIYMLFTQSGITMPIWALNPVHSDGCDIKALKTDRDDTEYWN